MKGREGKRRLSKSEGRERRNTERGENITKGECREAEGRCSMIGGVYDDGEREKEEEKNSRREGGEGGKDDEGGEAKKGEAEKQYEQGK